MAKEYPLRIIPIEIFDESSFVYIVAGGPSLRGFDWRRLDGKQTIAINKALYTCPTAKVLWWSDDRFFEENRDTILAHKAPYKCTAYSDHVRFIYPDTIYAYRFNRMRGFDDSVSGISHGNNSGYAAIHFAVKLGAKKLVLLGYDFSHDKQGATHWHDGYFMENGNKRDHTEHTLERKMLPNFASLEIPLKQRRVTVYNANKDSKLTCWPRITIEEALALA